jgi:AraC family transcriptional regulator, regulatory protein of adaptative response / methylated-DNA-[protein]-cysteine methyltransferase
VNDFERVARIIRYLDEHHAEQPELAQLAAWAGLSPFHFHRLFSRWAGVTPKDFLQCLTARHARELLRRGVSVLDTALRTGLSGPGRLHDLCVQLEAASPGELKNGGSGCDVRFGFAATPFGEWLVAQTDRGICHLAFVEERTTAFEELRSAWLKARLIEDDALARATTLRIFDNPPAATPPTLKAFVRGTPFQVRVWRALLRVPSGALTTYGQLAELCGSPRAARAVGTAVATNALAVLIPCHRVIRETGIIGEYRWGRERKRSLIAWESARSGFTGAQVK